MTETCTKRKKEGGGGGGGEEEKRQPIITCLTFSAFSHPLPAITIFMDPAWILSTPVPSLDLLAAAFGWWAVAERSASAFHKL